MNRRASLVLRLLAQAKRIHNAVKLQLSEATLRARLALAEAQCGEQQSHVLFLVYDLVDVLEHQQKNHEAIVLRRKALDILNRQLCGEQQPVYSGHLPVAA